MLCGVSGLAFAIGVYLPLSSMACLYVGGVVRKRFEKKAAGGAHDSDPGILAASGLVAGEGLAGIAIAAAAALKWIPKSADPRVGGLAGELLTLAVILAVLGFLHVAGRSAARHTTA
jgi:hypothetical protein